MTDGLPSYLRPPVTEVVLAAAFSGTDALSVAHLGHFWFTELREDLPVLDEQPPYDPPVETFANPSPLSLSLQLLTKPPSPRLWARSADGAKLLQLQRGWMAFNWRDAPGSAEPYPRWNQVEGLFQKYYRKLNSFLAREGIGNPTPLQCEVTYINNIPSGAVWKTHGDLHEVLSVLNETFGFLGKPETTELTTSFLILDNEKRTRGRLHVSAQPAFQRTDNKPALVLTITGRGAAFDETEAGVLSFLQLAHEWVVKGFTAITTEAMHREWGIDENIS